MEHLFICKCKLVITRKSRNEDTTKVIILCDTFVKGNATMYNLVKNLFIWPVIQIPSDVYPPCNVQPFLATHYMELILIKFRILICTFHNGGFLEWYRRQNGDMSVNLMMKECV
jgi:hypothetical protein